MAELVDALGSGPSGRKVVKVRVFSWANIGREAITSLFYVQFLLNYHLSYPIVFTHRIQARGLAAIISDCSNLYT